ncbi:hypothetical protein SteCoe_8176 [Stentor coeruleus]|uniref:Uncharacterized protein n=1 Tax=Stentor coeruleus TaxID=5963 RepID=A0A1R2CKW1_9CILI|nr:hypothetical protein SteCoe_8176 [Stentor coeruleus]
MEEAILNSILRYKTQLTPVRETYPLPKKSWSKGLRSSTPIINYSTYYILKSPSLKSPPKISHERGYSNASTNALSPDKRSSLYSPINEPKQTLKSSPKKYLQANNIKKTIQKDIPERPKFFRNARKNTNPKLNDEENISNEKITNNLKDKFEEYKKEQEIRENKVKEDIGNLKEMLKRSAELIEASQLNLEQ